MELNQKFIQTKTVKIYWDAVFGVFIEGHHGDTEKTKHPHIMFVGIPAPLGEIIFEYRYTPETWEKIKSYTLSNGWKTGPQVVDGFEFSSIWRNADIIEHDNEGVLVKYNGITKCDFDTSESTECDECEN
jgi:hypothetical protein